MTQKNNRAATFFLYLEDSSGRWRNDDACRTGLQIVPKKGLAVLFY
eukprot:gene38306-5491_t